MGTKNLFERFDKILESYGPAVKYAEEHFEELRDREQNAAKKVMTSLAYDLGIACPSRIIHKVIRGNKRGRIIKEVPKGEDRHYTIFSYDEGGNPVAVRPYNKWGAQDAKYFFQYDGYIWAVRLYDHSGEGIHSDLYRMLYEDGKIRSFYIIGGTHHLWGEEYEYPLDESEPIRCTRYAYVPTRVETSKDVPAGQEHSPMDERLYEISRDGRKIAEYVKEGDGYEFCREYVSGNRKKSATPKPAPDTSRKFCEWLDGELENELPDKSCGVYFSLTEGNEDGFDITMCFTESFDKEDEEWACNVTEEFGTFTVSTNGECRWEDILVWSCKYLKKYLQKGKQRDILKSFAGTGAGFDEGDVEIIKG